MSPRLPHQQLLFLCFEGVVACCCCYSWLCAWTGVSPILDFSVLSFFFSPMALGVEGSSQIEPWQDHKGYGARTHGTIASTSGSHRSKVSKQVSSELQPSEPCLRLSDGQDHCCCCCSLPCLFLPIPDLFIHPDIHLFLWPRWVLHVNPAGTSFQYQPPLFSVYASAIPHYRG